MNGLCPSHSVTVVELLGDSLPRKVSVVNVVNA
jgi:hypothetical protein